MHWRESSEHSQAAEIWVDENLIDELPASSLNELGCIFNIGYPILNIITTSETKIHNDHIRSHHLSTN